MRFDGFVLSSPKSNRSTRCGESKCDWMLEVSDILSLSQLNLADALCLASSGHTALPGTSNPESRHKDWLGPPGNGWISKVNWLWGMTAAHRAASVLSFETASARAVGVLLVDVIPQSKKQTNILVAMQGLTTQIDWDPCSCSPSPPCLLLSSSGTFTPGQQSRCKSSIWGLVS